MPAPNLKEIEWAISELEREEVLYSNHKLQPVLKHQMLHMTA